VQTRIPLPARTTSTAVGALVFGDGRRRCFDKTKRSEVRLPWRRDGGGRRSHEVESPTENWKQGLKKESGEEAVRMS
jgi:hypothetical protein